MKNFAHLSILLYTLAILSHAQTNDFSSGSSGVDGNLIFDIANGANQTFEHLANGHNGVWNFNQIIIPQGVTVTFPIPYASGTPPVIWLATGDVEIHGTISLNGESGKSGLEADTPGEEPKGGPGGFAGGLFGADGYGPGGGEGIAIVGSINAPNGTFSGIYGNRFLQPIIGGSGGAGVHYNDVNDRRVSGGGGGGAILIASSTSITVNGTVECNGGGTASEEIAVVGPDHTIQSGSGSGGGIRLVADRIVGTGILSAIPNGRIAIEAFDVAEFDVAANPLTYYLNVNPTTTFSLSPGTVRILTIDGAGVAAPALGRTQNPDVFFANSGLITVTVECSNIPLGAQVSVVLKSTVIDAPVVNALTDSYWYACSLYSNSNVYRSGRSRRYPLPMYPTKSVIRFTKFSEISIA